MTTPDDTTDPAARSWVESANHGETDFPIQNLPFAIFRRRDDTRPWRPGVAIGDDVLDLGGLSEDGLLIEVDQAVLQALQQRSLNAMMAIAPSRLAPLRTSLHRLLRTDASASHQQRARHHLVPQQEVELALPARIGDYTDFYASINHATNVGRLLRPDEPLLPNYKHLPVGYHGRASSVVPSGSSVRRPLGQRRSSTGVPTFGPSERLDFELELGAFVAQGNDLGVPIPIAKAAGHLFGVCLLNDWSARDIQAWEYQPLGPFLAKSFATSLSPWVITLDALVPYRVPVPPRAPGDPRPLPYLWADVDQAAGAFAIDLEVSITTRTMRKDRMKPVRLAHANFQTMYWTLAQMVAHHTSNGCNLQPGDLIGSGTVSGGEPGMAGSLLELTAGGRAPLRLPNGETRTFLEDEDEIVLRGSCGADGQVRIGFGECRGRIRPARALDPA